MGYALSFIASGSKAAAPTGAVVMGFQATADQTAALDVQIFVGKDVNDEFLIGHFRIPAGQTLGPFACPTPIGIPPADLFVTVTFADAGANHRVLVYVQ